MIDLRAFGHTLTIKLITRLAKMSTMTLPKYTTESRKRTTNIFGVYRSRAIANDLKIAIPKKMDRTQSVEIQ